jgi:hypothetical protein
MGGCATEVDFSVLATFFVAMDAQSFGTRGGILNFIFISIFQLKGRRIIKKLLFTYGQ